MSNLRFIIPANTTTGPTSASQISGTLAPANGGTGLSAPGTSGNVLVSNGSVWTSAAPASSSGGVTTGLTVALAIVMGF